MDYDDNNVFAKILRREIPTKVIYENDYVISFYTIDPKADVHALIIPKGSYTDYRDFMKRGDDIELISFFRSIDIVAERLGISESYKLVTNFGRDAGQEVFHFHVHLLHGNIANDA